MLHISACVRLNSNTAEVSPKIVHMATIDAL